MSGSQLVSREVESPTSGLAQVGVVQGGLSEDKIRELIRASRLEPVFAPEEVVATPVEFTTKPKAKPGRKPQISSDLRMLDVLIKELGERKLKPSEKQHLKGQITTLMNLL